MRFVTILLISLFINDLKSQSNQNFVMDLPINLSGTFGELRTNHFHSGIDIKTNRREGLNIYSYEKGYISRIQVSTYGYGKAIYITHPDGKTTVYAHLSKFSEKIQNYVKDIQYKRKKFAIKVYPKESEILIEKNEIIGYSGNTGSSSGPHLHFELRDKNNMPVNPLKYRNIEIIDTIIPLLKGVYYKELKYNNGKLEDNYSRFKKIKFIENDNGKYLTDTLYTNGVIGFGVNSFDLMNNSNNVYGLNKIITKINDSVNFKINFDKFSFDEWTYINTYVDYAYFKRTNDKIQKLYIENINPLNLYDRSLGDGALKLNDSKNILINYKIILFDFNNNTTVINIPIVFTDQTKEEIFQKKGNINIQNNLDKKIRLENYFVEFKKGTFDYNASLTISESNNTINIDNDTIPLRKPFTIKYSLKNIDDSRKKYLYLGMKGPKNYHYFISNEKFNDSIIGHAKKLGKFKILTDSIPPDINFYNLKNDQWISNRKKLTIKINDNESGIKSFNGWINNKWILLEYESKKNMLTYDFEDKVNSNDSKNELVVSVKDNCGNVSMKKITFYRKIYD